MGIVSFCIPLLLSFSSEHNLATKLSRGEVRKSIVISLTVMYILLLPLSFYYIPIEAIGNFTQNFLYVYVIIIGFYFGSRLGERIKMLKEFKNLKPLEILQKRYAMGEIDSNTFDNMKESLAEQEELLILHKLFETREITADEYKKLKNEFKKS